MSTVSKNGWDAGKGDTLNALFVFAQGPEHLQVPIRQGIGDPSL